MSGTIKEFFIELQRKSDGSIDFDVVEGPQPQYSDDMRTAIGPIRASTWEEAVTLQLGKSVNFSFSTEGRTNTL